MIGPAITAPKMTAPASDRVAAKWIMRIKISGSPTPSLPGGDVRRTLGEPICRRERYTRPSSNGRRPRSRATRPCTFRIRAAAAIPSTRRGPPRSHGITLVDLLAGGVAHHDGAEFGLELLGEMKRD